MKRKYFYWCITILLLTISIYLLKQKYDMTREYYLDGGETKVTNHVRAGFKIIGDSKLWSPKPEVLEIQDLEKIKKDLPAWLQKQYPKDDIDPFFLINIKNNELKEHLQYIYTILFWGEDDVYILHLQLNEKRYEIYVLIGGKDPYFPEYRLNFKNEEEMSEFNFNEENSETSTKTLREKATKILKIKTIVNKPSQNYDNSIIIKEDPKKNFWDKLFE